ncbi:signal transduction histidine-protein kinase/phosphatase UhpB [Vibrio sp. 2-Bac 85]
MSGYITTLVYTWLLILCCLFCLWVLSNHFVELSEFAVLLFPFGFRIGVILHCPKKYWVSIYGAELALIAGLIVLFNSSEWGFLIGASLISIPILNVAHNHYNGSQWKRLRIIGLVILVLSMTNTICYALYYDDLWSAFLCSITGGIMLAPSCYLIWSYLFQNSWNQLTADFINEQFDLRNRHLFLYLLLFVVNVFAQAGLPEELRRFAPFCLAIPIVLLAYRYGWQGALLATSFNSIALMVTQTNAGHSMDDLLLSLSAQTLTGILLGVGVQRQRDLNTQLMQELDRNKSIAKQLVKAEEDVRRDIARELHDEIGQNITAIRTQANILQRIDNIVKKHNHAQTIEQLSLNIYDTTRGLLNRLRPKVLDELGLEGAIRQLITELEFSSQKIETFIHYDIAEHYLNDTLSATLFRICQESLNNIIKYAQASEVTISLFKKTMDKESKYYLIIADNGIGLKETDKNHGFGLVGIQERVQALGGDFSITSHEIEQKYGTRLTVILPSF